MNIGLVGLGSMGKLHLKNILQLQSIGICKLTCVCDINKELAKDIGIKYQVPWFDSVDTMLADESIDAVVIAATSTAHFALARRFIEKKIPVLVEKPVVINLEEAAELKDLSDREGVLLSAGFTEVYNSVSTGVVKILKKEDSFDYIDFFRIGQKSTRNDTKDIDVVQDLMIHDIAVLSQLIDLKLIKDISGYYSSFNQCSGKYDTACVSMLLETGKIVRLFCDRNGTTKIRRFTLSKGDMYCEFDYMDQTAQVYKRGLLEAFGENIWYSQNYDAAKIRYSNNPLYDELRDFITAVSEAGNTKVSKNWFEITETIEKIRIALYDKSGERL